MTTPTKLVQSTFCPFREDCAAPGAIHLYPEPKFTPTHTLSYQEELHKHQRMYMQQLETRNAIRCLAQATFPQGMK